MHISIWLVNIEVKSLNFSETQKKLLEEALPDTVVSLHKHNCPNILITPHSPARASNFFDLFINEFVSRYKKRIKTVEGSIYSCYICNYYC